MKIDVVRRAYSISEILGTKKRLIVCPLPFHVHARNTPSFSIFMGLDGVQRWRCHGSCNLEGDVVDLIGYMNIVGYDRHNGKMNARAAQMLQGQYSITMPDETFERRTEIDPVSWVQYTPPGQEVIEYASKRGLSLETLERFKIGQHESWMTIPCFEEEALVGIKMRNTGSGMRFMSAKGSRTGLFNYDRIFAETGMVLIVKGEIPCMLLDQMGYKACAPTSGEGAWRQAERWKMALALAHPVVIGDNDEPGKILGEKRAALLRAKLSFPPPEFKDIDEFILASPEEAKSYLKNLEEQ